MDKILDFKERYVNESLEALRGAKEIGQSLEAEIRLCPKGSISDVLKRRRSIVRNIYRFFSDCRIFWRKVVSIRSTRSRFSLSTKLEMGARTSRGGEWGQVSPRCAEVLKIKF